MAEKMAETTSTSVPKATVFEKLNSLNTEIEASILGFNGSRTDGRKKEDLSKEFEVRVYVHVCVHVYIVIQTKLHLPNPFLYSIPPTHTRTHTHTCFVSVVCVV